MRLSLRLFFSFRVHLEVGGLEVVVLLLVLGLNLFENGLNDLKEGVDREAEEEAEVASDVRDEVVAGVHLEVGVDLQVWSNLKNEDVLKANQRKKCCHFVF